MPVAIPDRVPRLTQPLSRPARAAHFIHPDPVYRNFNSDSFRRMIMAKIPVYLTYADAAHLGEFAANRMPLGPARDALQRALRGAIRVAPGRLPVNVVSLHSTVRVHDRRTRAVKSYTLVLPGEDMHAPDRIGVLTPFGLALLGAHVGDFVAWDTPSGTRTLQVEAVTHPAAPVRARA